MILERKPLTIVETRALVKETDDNKDLIRYLKKFSKLKQDKVSSLKEEISSLNNLKIKEENLVKLSDFVPKTQEEVNKIFTDVSLNEEEINDILEITKKY